MIFLKSMVVLILALLIQTALMQWGPAERIHPDFVLLFLIYFSFKHGPITGVFCGFFIGLIQDVYAIESLGANTLAKSLIGYFAGLLDETRFSFTSFTKVLFLAFSIIIHDTLTNLAAGAGGETYMALMLSRTLPVLLLTLICGTVLFYYFGRKSVTDD